MDVVHHWRRFIEGSPTVDELYDLLLAGFWRGELMLRGGDGRTLLARETLLESLRNALVRSRGLERLTDGLVFWSENEESELGPRVRILSDGGAEVDVRTRIQLPANSSQWSEGVLETAFPALANVSLSRLPLDFMSGLYPQQVLKDDFARFCDLNGFARPGFWFGPTERKPVPKTTGIAVKRFQRWFVEQIKCPQRHSKDKYRQLALETFPGLSASLFDQEWRRMAPDSWQKPGRRRGLSEPAES